MERQMEEITIRFEIVRLAVKVHDNVTIAIQAQKLGELSIDEHLTEIVSLLESKNYRQAIYLMKGYVASLDDSFFKEPSPIRPPRKERESHEESQSLFDIMQPTKEKTINLDDMLRMTEESIEKPVEYKEPEIGAYDYVALAKKGLEAKRVRAQEPKMKLLDEEQMKIDRKDEYIESENLTADLDNTQDVDTESIEDMLNVKHDSDENDNYFEIPVEKKIEEEKIEKPLSYSIDDISRDDDDPYSSTEEIVPELEPEEVAIETEELEERVKEMEKETILDKDTQFDILQNQSTKVDELPAMELPITEEPDINLDVEDKPDEAIVDEDTIEEELSEELDEVDTLDEVEPKVTRETKIYKRYPPISYIDQKYRNMKHQYPQIEESEGDTPFEIEMLLGKVATDGYTDEDIIDAIVFFQKAKEEGHKSEAAQMLLLVAASESKHAQLMLARELFKGDVLELDYAEAFTQINRLAEQDYPEAICDLAQLYEYGYGIKKDKKTAIMLYEEAIELGVDRAQKHYDRLTTKKGLFGSVFG